jgi:NADPH2:quinone reductase
VVRPADTVELPAGVDHRLIAALGLSAVAAHMALTWRGGLQPGAQVLVLGGGGVVGQAGIQLALLGGARRVIAACRSSASRERALRLGAAACVPTVDDVTTLAASLREIADGPVDLVLDPLFGVPAAAALRTLRPGGVLVNLGSSAGETAPFDSAALRSGSLNVLGYTNNNLTVDQRAQAMRVIAEHVAAGRLTADYEPVSFAGVGEAWSRQAGGTADRRIVLAP